MVHALSSDTYVARSALETSVRPGRVSVTLLVAGTVQGAGLRTDGPGGDAIACHTNIDIAISATGAVHAGGSAGYAVRKNGHQVTISNIGAMSGLTA